MLGRVRWAGAGVFLCIGILINSCGIQIEVERSKSTASDEKRHEIMVETIRKIEQYEVATLVYKDLVVDSNRYPYPIFRDRLKLIALHDGLASHTYEIEVMPLFNNRLQNYSVLKVYGDSLVVIGFIDEQGVLFIDVLNIRSWKALRSIACKLPEGETLFLDGLEMINDTLFVIGCSKSTYLYAYFIKYANNGKCDVINKLAIDSVYNGENEPFHIVDFKYENDTVYAVIYMQSSGWDSNFVALFPFSSDGKWHGEMRDLGELIPFSTLENTNNLNAGRVALINKRVALKNLREFIALHPFKPIAFINDGSFDTLESMLNPELYAFQDSVLTEKFNAFVCRSGTIVSIPEFEATESMHGYVQQNKIVQGKNCYGTNVFIKDTLTKGGLASLFVQVINHERLRKFRTVSVISILDGLRLVGKIGGSPFSRKEINRMKVNLNSPAEFTSAVGYYGVGGCVFLSADSLLCVAYIPDDMPVLNTENTIVQMKDIPFAGLREIGSRERVSVRLVVAIWEIVDE